MQVVCEATQNNAVPVQVGAFECIVKIMSLYYEKMDFYMERALFGVSGHKGGVQLELALTRSVDDHGHAPSPGASGPPGDRVLEHRLRGGD
jgi:hypothetical protein